MMTQGNFKVPMVCFICKLSNLLIYSNHFSTHFHLVCNWRCRSHWNGQWKEQKLPPEIKAIYYSMLIFLLEYIFKSLVFFTTLNYIPDCCFYFKEVLLNSFFCFGIHSLAVVKFYAFLKTCIQTSLYPKELHDWSIPALSRTHRWSLLSRWATGGLPRIWFCSVI